MKDEDTTLRIRSVIIGGVLITVSNPVGCRVDRSGKGRLCELDPRSAPEQVATPAPAKRWAQPVWL